MHHIQTSPKLRAELDLLRSKFPKPILFPWVGLSELIERLDKKTLPIVGYGSLLNQASAARTLKNALRVPCVAFGCKRIFNYDMPKDALDKYGTNDVSSFRAALNVEVTGNIDHSINGILTELHPADIEAFREREKGYDLVPISCVEWNATLSSVPFTAFVLAAPDCARNPNWQVVRSDILPHSAYLRLCETGAKSISNQFLEFFRETTFLADKKTPISTWQTHDI